MDYANIGNSRYANLDHLDIFKVDRRESHNELSGMDGILQPLKLAMTPSKTKIP